MEIYKRKTTNFGSTVVPLVDIMTILLIFFIVNTQWKKKESLLNIDVPSTHFIEGHADSKTRCVLSVSADSAIALDGEIVDIEKLAVAIKNALADEAVEGLQLDLDKGSSFGTVVQIWDILTSLGIDVSDVPARIELNKTPRP